MAKSPKKSAKKAVKKAGRKALRKPADTPKPSVFENLTLKGVRLIKLSADLQITDGKIPTHSEINTNASVGPSADGSAILVDGYVITKSQPKEPGENPSTLLLQAHYQCVYQMTEGTATESFVPHAAELCMVGMMAMWPYFRELIQSVTSRMGVPPITLPMMLTGPIAGGAGSNVRMTEVKD